MQYNSDIEIMEVYFVSETRCFRAENLKKEMPYEQ